MYELRAHGRSLNFTSRPPRMLLPKDTLCLRTVDNTVPCCTVPTQTPPIPIPRSVVTDMVRICTPLVRWST
ncbi:hypothetical protein SCLCIDRAFT_1220341 [Scleroderma citrinum Foug A]|uniref:Uncharacterized protein n=1 Tax=Scleroderma citrinum Foug A TaxID=1036808 RepID=A0A0C3DJL9_9AGAM|nr:hypothetical protein SCLCIDRAFT_1220341 [Scleroderma citrinum Foug A]